MTDKTRSVNEFLKLIDLIMTYLWPLHIADDAGLNRSQSSVLREISIAGPMTLSQLAE